MPFKHNKTEEKITCSPSVFDSAFDTEVVLKIRYGFSFQAV